MNATIVSWDPRATTKQWFSTTLDRVGKSEEFLEEFLANYPSLLGLESRTTGIHGPYVAYRQRPLSSPSGRLIFPDIIFLTGSGHVLVVEAKRFVNPELRERAVIAQLIDYASSLAVLADDNLLKLLDSTASARSWGEYIATVFPNESNLDELSSLLRRRIQSGQINLVIACDRIPSGLPDVVAGIASQSALGFDLDLVTVTPYVTKESIDAEILFSPHTRLRTEIVSRSAVVVTYRAGDMPPTASVKVTSAEEVESSVKRTQAGSRPLKVWTIDDFQSILEASGDPLGLQILKFALEHSAGGRVSAGDPVQNPTFAFYLAGETATGKKRQLQAFNSNSNEPSIYVYSNFIEQSTSPHVYAEFMRRIEAMFGQTSKTSDRQFYISYDSLRPHWEEFKELILWIKANVVMRDGDVVTPRPTETA